MENIPLPVWQQIGIVVIFCLLLLGLAGFLGKLLVSGFLKALEGINSSFSIVIAQSDGRWQKVVSGNDEKWKAFYEAQLKSDDNRTAKFIEEFRLVTAGLNNLSVSFPLMHNAIASHDNASKIYYENIMSSLATLTFIMKDMKSQLDAMEGDHK